MTARMVTRVLKGLVGALAVSALVVPGAAAKGPGGGGGHGGGGGGGGTGEVTANNLSVPAMFVGGVNPYGLSCNGSSEAPTGEPSSGYSEPGSYYVQGVHTWQAGCLEVAAPVTANAQWGDNLGGDAKLKVGSPIRVEVGLFGQAPEDLTGWEVIKLEPEQLDRVSPYGTLATLDGGAWESQPVTPYPETRVWAAGAHLRIADAVTDVAVYDGPATAEINSTGRVVYGYNLRVTAAGDYTITFTFPDVTIDGSNTVSTTIGVVPGGGKGGGKGGGNH